MTLSSTRKAYSAALSRFAIVGYMVALVGSLAPSPSLAQSIEGFNLGDDKSTLLRLGSPEDTKSNGPFTTLTFHTKAGIELEATYQKPSDSIVSLQATWKGTGTGPSASLGEFKFGETTLADLRRKFGSLGVLYKVNPAIRATPSGSIEISTFYDISTTANVVKFVTLVGRDDVERLKTNFGSSAYRNSGDVAKLRSITIAKRDYLEKTQGITRILDAGYRAISWDAPAIQPATHPSISLARIMPSQLPVFRVYSGPNNFPDFTGRDREFSNFRTRIADGMTSGPTFAGEYAVIQIGCGTGCSFAYVANNRTGEVFEMPIGGEANAYLTLKYGGLARSAAHPLLGQL